MANKYKVGQIIHVKDTLRKYDFIGEIINVDEYIEYKVLSGDHGDSDDDIFSDEFVFSYDTMWDREYVKIIAEEKSDTIIALFGDSK